MGMQALRSMYWVNSSVCGEAASTGSTSPVSWWCRAATLSGTSSWTVAVAACAASTPTTTGSSSYVTWIRSAASSAMYRSVATTIAIGSPTCRTMPLASG